MLWFRGESSRRSTRFHLLNDSADFRQDERLRGFSTSHSELSFLDKVGLAARTSPVVHTATSTASRSSRHGNESE